MKIRQGFVSNSSTSSFIGVGWSTYDLNAGELIINIVKTLGMPPVKNRGSVSEFVDFVNNHLGGDISLLTTDLLEEAQFELDELLEYFIEAYDSKLQYNYSGYDERSISAEFPDCTTLDEFVLKINALASDLKVDPLYIFMVKYAGEPYILQEAWSDH